MKQNIASIKNEECTGCGVCATICPKKAISFIEGSGGYVFPMIDNVSKCNHCGLCFDTCPVNSPPRTNDYLPESYVVKASKEIRSNSSSGGVFTVLSNYVLSLGGIVVGVGLSGSKATFSIATTHEEIEKFKGSKYVFSYTNDIYYVVKNYLMDEKLVLFSGCPCQIAALRNYLQKPYSNLITFDIFCHGMVSEKIYQSYLKENKLYENLKTVEFRNKEEYGWDTRGQVYYFKNGSVKKSDNDIYYRTFLSDIASRDSCINCKFSTAPRTGDISAGDFWDAKHTPCELDDGQGLSALLLNTQKGKEVFEKVKNEFEYEKITYKKAMSWNRHGQLYINPQRKRFLKIFDQTGSISVAFDHCINWKYDIGIFGPTNNTNYGGALTYFALYKVLDSMGFDCLLINNPLLNKNSSSQTHSRDFFKTHTIMSVQRTRDAQHEINPHIDTVILGSDQVWNYNLFATWGDLLYLSFVDESKKMISYASSFGVDELTIPNDKLSHISRLMNRFDYISVRESAGTRLLQKLGVDGHVVLDPVFLMDKKEYDTLKSESNLLLPLNYIGAYIINPNIRLRLDLIKKIEKELELPSFSITDGDPESFNDRKKKFEDANLKVLDLPGLADWVKLIMDSSFFITDSYHAACLCVLFNKKFIIVQDSWATSRIEELSSTFAIENRWIKSLDDLLLDPKWFEPLNWEHNYMILNSKIIDNVGWIKNSIMSPKTITNKIPIRENISKRQLSRKDRSRIIQFNESDYVVGNINEKRKYSIWNKIILGETTIKVIKDGKILDISIISLKNNQYHWLLKIDSWPVNVEISADYKELYLLEVTD